MRTVAVYNMKGGVGKTTAAVNLSYCAAAAGRRTLLWDLDPQAASTFAFRVPAHVSAFSKTSLEDGQALGAAIKETDYPNLHLLPADFAYRKFERFLGSLGKPERLVPSLLDELGRDFDVVFLDCPAGFSLLTEGVFAAADVILVPTIPTVLSLRTVLRAIKWAEESGTRSRMAAFFSMVDRRKTLHRRACELSSSHPEVFLSSQIPYASVVEQMAVRRMPLAAFAARDPATAEFAAIWMDIQAWRRQAGDWNTARAKWGGMLHAIESVIAQLESAGLDRPAPQPVIGRVSFVHRFDTERRDLEQSGHVLELLEGHGILLVVAAQSGHDGGTDATRRAQAQIDGSWACRILSGELSPLEALERRLGPAGPHPIEIIRAMVGRQRLHCTSRRIATQPAP